MRLHRFAIVCLLLLGCGRIEFGGEARPDAAEIDAPDLVEPIHSYRFAGTLDDEHGGPALVARGGTLGPDGYRFGVNQGLAATEVAPAGAYSIAITFAFDDVGGYRKLIDFKGLTTDEGLYVFDEKLQFVIVAANQPVVITSRPLFAAGVLTSVRISRDTAGTVALAVNDAPELTFRDDMQVAVFTRAGRVANIVLDDMGTAPNEASAGVIREIAVWDVALP